MCVFFFKQKTAYEMRISDWSSDVCSSDLKNPEATAEAWRNGWFHTGDLFRKDADGNYFFVDRKKDAIRRRGENISSFEIEAEVLAHPDIRETAAIGVDNDIRDRKSTRLNSSH